MIDYYEILGLPYTATDSQIGEVYRRLKIETEGNPERLRQVEEAYAILANPIRRKKYLASLITTKSGGTQVPREGTIVHPLPPALSTKDTSAPGSSHKQTTESLEPGQDVRLQPSIQPIKPKTSPGGQIKRQPTEFIDTKQEVEHATPQKTGKPASQPETHTKRQPTEFFEQDQVVKPEPPRQTIEIVSPSLTRPARQPTEFYELEQPIQPSFISEHPKVSQGRQPTEFVESEPNEKPQNEAQMLQTPSPSVIAKRQPTEHPGPVGEIPKSPRPGLRLPTYPMAQAITQAPTEPFQAPPVYQRKDYYVQVSYLGKIETFPLKPGKNIIGRPLKQGSLPDIPLPDPTKYISRKQAIISVEGNQLTITDPGSSNGTSLNSVRMAPMQAYPLTENDLITIEGRELSIKPVS